MIKLFYAARFPAYSTYQVLTCTKAGLMSKPNLLRPKVELDVSPLFGPFWEVMFSDAPRNEFYPEQQVQMDRSPLITLRATVS